jgi:DNA (cytosine-5)-methyltransferase 1
MRSLDLFSGIGGNRYKWDNCEVTAVELDPHLASMYKQRFPQDTVLVEDAHEYLKNYYQEFDFIWTSPPCPSHSRARFGGHAKCNNMAIYPDMKLYEEVLFLQHHFDGKYVVENVIPYYEPLIQPQKRGRHLYWANFLLPEKIGREEVKGNAACGILDEVNVLCKLNDLTREFLNQYPGPQRKDKIMRNLVDYQAGLDIFNAARGTYEENTDQTNFLEIMEASK